MKFNSKVFFKVFIFLLIAVVLSVYLYGSGHRSCYHFVENLNYNCDNISDLENYIDYNMLSNDLKKLIKEEDFKFSNAEEQYQFCRLLKNLNYEYKENPDNVYSTDKLGRNELSRRIFNKYINCL